MDKDFLDLLVKYLDGNCTAAEMERINRWYEKIADTSLQIEKGEQDVMKAQIWSEVQKTLSQGSKPSGKRRYLVMRPWLKVAAAVAILAMCGVWFFSSHRLSSRSPLAEIPEMSDEMIFENRTSKPRTFGLPDGSSVRLEASSEIHFAKGFLSGKREVYLTGKAFFDIVQDPTRPFYVYSGSIVTWVLGTTFYVDAPANASKVEVEVVTGRVSVFQRANQSSKSENQSSTNGVILSPNQRVEYFIEGEGGHWVTGLVEEPVPVKSLDVERLSLVFSNTSMKDVLNEIQERYGIEVVTENDRIEACAFTGDVSKMSLYDMLSVISNSIGSTYEVKGTRILIGGPGCN